MDGMKVIHLEDSVDKHMKVCRELQKIGVISVEWATSVSEGLEKIEAARQEGAPYELVISDMHYPIWRGEAADWEAGEYLLKALAERNIHLPVIICSTREKHPSSGHHLLHPELPHTGRVWQYLVF